MNKILIGIFFLLIIIVILSAKRKIRQENFDPFGWASRAVKDVGRTFDNVGRDVGRTFDNVGRDVGKTVNSVSRDVGKSFESFNPSKIFSDLSKLGTDIANIFKKVGNFDKIFKSLFNIMDLGSQMLPKTVALLKVTGDVVPHLLRVLSNLLHKLKLLVQIMVILVNRLGHCAKFSMRFKKEVTTKFEFLHKYISNLIELSDYCSGGPWGKNPITFTFKCGMYLPGYGLFLFMHSYKIVLAIIETIKIIRDAPELFPQEGDKNWGNFGGSKKMCEDKLNSILSKNSTNNKEWNDYVEQCNQCLNFRSIINVKYTEIFELKNILDELIRILNKSKPLEKLIPELTNLTNRIVGNIDYLGRL